MLNRNILSLGINVVLSSFFQNAVVWDAVRCYITIRSVLCAIDFTLNVGRNEMLESEDVTVANCYLELFFVNLPKLSIFHFAQWLKFKEREFICFHSSVELFKIFVFQVTWFVIRKKKVKTGKN